MAILFDLEPLSEQQTCCALEAIYKSIHDHGDDDAIWNPHESPYIRRLIELFTQRGLMRLGGFRDELTKWVDGERHRDGARPPRPPGMMQRWSEGELELVKLYLETLPPAEFVLDDWLMLVDYLVMRYLPAGDLRTEAEWLSVRATLMGRVQANMDGLSAKQADIVLAALPSTVSAAVGEFRMSPVQRATIDYATAHAAENVQKLSDDARHRIRSVIIRNHEQQVLRIAGTPGTSLQSDLLDAFGTMNRDWRRIAVTEAGDAANQGFIATLQPGARVRRLEQYKGACAFCRKIDGMELNVVDPAAADKDGWKDVWVGKSNVGRSGALRKRVGDRLAERTPEELWWPAAGTQHPHCRGRWLPVLQDEPGDDPEFGAWLRAKLGKKNATV